MNAMSDRPRLRLSASLVKSRDAKICILADCTQWNSEYVGRPILPENLD